MSLFTGSTAGLVPIHSELRDMCGIDEQQLTSSSSLRFLAERIGQDLARKGRLSDRGLYGRESWTARTASALRLLVMRPFARLDEIAAACHTDTDEAMRIVQAIQGHHETAALLAKFGADAPYRHSTIQPIIDSGAVQAFLNGWYRYPFTIGVYPAVTCMLSCSFCARARGVEYKREDIIPGNKLLRQLFEQAPQDSPRRFYLSGGLEPLTNPGLAELVHFAAGLGHRMQLYTNAMMLTEKFLAANEGLWDLETLRISMYGADDATALQTTQRNGVATRVLANARSLVRAKSKRGSNLRVGFNHVVQSGQISHLRKLAQAFVEIADESPDRKGVNFWTLRENYAASGEVAISGDERLRLRDELIDLQSFFRAEGMEDFVLDLGYGMRGLVEGIETAPVRRVAHTDMLGRGYPQISVVIDLLGDVYLYREAGFIGRAGADRYIIGRLTPELGLPELLQRYLDDRNRYVVPRMGDEIFLDAFDHAVTAYLRQASDDLNFGSNLSGIASQANVHHMPANLWR